ncbi:GDSL esterase/lipase CPRD49-like [Ixodes scapularis]|uniref:GDSL esterase/lipase CPRD49-like n=1 Tax=Ixodes scapularis TaxID=6945 RepID=UPI001A9E971C|nr:GDSL esterase/lipase CPRD49-like [Ixodes scapularis]
MVKYLPLNSRLAVEVAPFSGIRIEHLFSQVSEKLPDFDVILHVGTNNSHISASVYIDKYRRLAAQICERNPMMQIAFSVVLPRRENRFCSLEWQRSHAAEIEASNDRYREVNSLLRELCRREGFTFLDGLADEWHQWIHRDGVHPNRIGNKVLAGFMGQQVWSILEKMARAKIQQDHKEAMPGTLSWDGWTIKGALLTAPCCLFRILRLFQQSFVNLTT